MTAKQVVLMMVPSAHCKRIGKDWFVSSDEDGLLGSGWRASSAWFSAEVKLRVSRPDDWKEAIRGSAADYAAYIAAKAVAA